MADKAIDKAKARKKLKKLQAELEEIVVERTAEIEGALAALISRSHVLFLGPPGTAKSLLAEKICQAIDGGKFFRWLLTKYTTPDEIFGPPSLKGLEEDKLYRIIKNKLPEAVIAFMDEIFKSNSALLNSLLTAINERKFDNNGDAPMDIPLISCFGASNELPESEELSALYDRFLLRYWITEIQDDQNFLDVISGTKGNKDPQTKITMEELSALSDAVDEIEIPADTLSSIRKLHGDLKKKGITASDRRWKSALRVIKAVAFIRGNTEVTPDELDLFADMLWAKPEDRKAILGATSAYGNPLNAKALEWLDAAKELLDKAEESGQKGASPARIEANAGLADILGKIDETLKTADPKFTAKLVEVQGKIKEYQHKNVQALTDV